MPLDCYSVLTTGTPGRGCGITGSFRLFPPHTPVISSRREKSPREAPVSHWDNRVGTSGLAAGCAAQLTRSQGTRRPCHRACVDENSSEAASGDAGALWWNGRFARGFLTAVRNDEGMAVGEELAAWERVHAGKARISIRRIGSQQAAKRRLPS